MEFAMRRFLLAIVMCGAVSGAQAADLADLPVLRGGFGPTSRVNWQGWYVGGQVSYGSVTSKVPSNINGDMQSTFIRPANVDYNWQPLGMAHDQATGFGAFAGYNSQWDDVVVGLEANYVHDGFRSASTSTGLRYLADNVTLESITHSAAVVSLSDFGSLRVRGG
jgi:outer membrane immunogenic protein